MFLNVVLQGVHFDPVIAGASTFFVNNDFHNSKKVDFLRNFKILYPGNGPRYSDHNFFPDGPWGPRIMKAKICPDPENLAKIVKFWMVGPLRVPGGNIVEVT